MRGLDGNVSELCYIVLYIVFTNLFSVFPLFSSNCLFVFVCIFPFLRKLLLLVDSFVPSDCITRVWSTI